MKILAWSPVWLPLFLIESWAVWELWFNKGDHLGFGSGAPGVIHFAAILVVFFTCIAIVALIGRGLYKLARYWDRKLREADAREYARDYGKPTFRDLAKKAERMDATGPGRRPEHTRPTGSSYK